MTGFCICMGKWFQSLLVSLYVPSHSSLKEVLVKCKCIINNVSVKWRPGVVGNKASCVAKLERKWRFTVIWHWCLFGSPPNFLILAGVPSVSELGYGSWCIRKTPVIGHNIKKKKTQICFPFLNNPYLLYYLLKRLFLDQFLCWSSVTLKNNESYVRSKKINGISSQDLLFQPD